MTESTTPATSPLGFEGSTQIKPLSVRMTADVRAQLEIIAQLNSRNVTEEVREAIEHWIERSKSDPAVLKRAETVRAEIERDAATKRGAISAIFDAPAAEKKDATTSDETAVPSSSRRGSVSTGKS